MPRANNMITVVSRGEETPRKCTGTKSSKIGNNDFNCNKEGNFHPRQKWQHGSPVLSDENGEHKKTEINHRQQRNLVLPLIGIAQYLPEVLNVEANDRESRDLRDSSKWKLDPQVFKKTCLALGSRI